MEGKKTCAGEIRTGKKNKFNAVSLCDWMARSLKAVT